jgi:hypothetical protein
MKQQTRQLTTATAGPDTQLKQRKRQLATATVGQYIVEAADTTAGNSNSWPRHSAKATYTASCLSQLSKSWLKQHKQQLMLQLAACHSYQNHG